MPNRIKDQEMAFNKQYSRFKLKMFFKHRLPITHYGQERYGCTVAQIQAGYIKQVTLHRDFGLQDCINRIAICENKFGPYQVALIYDNRKDTLKADGTMQTGKEIRKYIKGEVVEWEEAFSSPTEKKILTVVIHPPAGGYKLKPVEVEQVPPAEQVDFKKDVPVALEKPKKRQNSLVYQSPNN